VVQNPVHPVGIPYTFRSRLQNEFKIMVVVMKIYAKIQSDDWLNEATLKRLKAELRIMKVGLRNRGRHPNGVVKSALPRFARLPNQTPSQSVAASRSDFWDGAVMLGRACPPTFEPNKAK
jgi:hypothetical protein